MIAIPGCLAFLVVLALASGTTVAAPILSVSRTVIDWGNVSFGVPTGTQSFDVTNVGDAPLELNAYVMIGYSGFDQGGPCDDVFTLPPGASCRMDITLTVTNRGAGPIAARFEIESTGGTAQVDLRAFNTGAGGAPPTFVLNQHGLTGSWFEPATSGQGIEIEVYPDLVAPGTGYLQGSWFTFDYVAAGGAATQRWYTFSGNVQTGQASATLTLYQNVGGNFNALPVTSATPVGSVVLSFADCTNATMMYTFTDGSGRSGTVPMIRLTPNVACSTSGASATNADFGHSGNWFDPTKSGQGIVLELNPNAAVAFFAWYTYAPNGQAQGAAGQRWYTGQGSYTPGARTLSMTLYETTGGLFDNPTPTAHSAPVGTATATFTACDAGKLEFTFTAGNSAGASGMFPLSRVGPTPAACSP